MELTGELALDKTIEVWEERVDSGSDDLRKCYLCVYAHPYCTPCPWYQNMGHCSDDDSPYIKWSEAKTSRSRKIWATRCLEILYAIQELEEDEKAPASQ